MKVIIELSEQDIRYGRLEKIEEILSSKPTGKMTIRKADDYTDLRRRLINHGLLRHDSELGDAPANDMHVSDLLPKV